jgi:Tol biopolymer transport system component
MDLPRAPERMTQTAGPSNPTTITPDGKWLVINASTVSGSGALTMVSTEARHETRPLPGTVAGGTNADISPDGQWIAYQSSGSGRSEIYVHPFPDTAAFRRPVALGTRPLWSPDSRELFYLDAERNLMSVRVETKPALSFGNPIKIFGNVRAMTPGRSYDISPDGKRFLVLKEPASASQLIRHLDVVLNWTESLRRLTEPPR